MSKVYQYRKHIKWGQYVLGVIFSIFIIAWVFLGVKLFLLPPASNHVSSSFQTVILVTMACGTIFFVAEGFFVWYLYYRLAGVKIIVENESVIYKHRGGETRINFHEITKINLPSIPYLGGWITIIAGKEKIRLTVVVNGIGDFVQTLKASLDKIGLANRYDEI